jgi:hypothetical protein
MSAIANKMKIKISYERERSTNEIKVLYMKRNISNINSYYEYTEK